jgi:signal transduction histidine kinase
VNFDTFALKALLFILAMLHFSPHPNPDSGWKVLSDWQLQDKGTFFLAAESTAIVGACAAEPDAFVKFPSIVHGAQIIRLDGQEVMRFGDPSLKQTRSFYGAPVLSCDTIKHGHTLKWEITSSTKFFSRFKEFPKIVRDFPLTNFFMETLNVVATGSLILLALFCFIIFYGKIPRRLLGALTFSIALYAGYFLGCAPEFFGLSIHMQYVHKLADICLWAASGLYMYCLHLEGLLPRKLMGAYAINIFIALLVIIVGKSGDTTQFGTTLPFLMTFVMYATAAINLIRKMSVNDKSRRGQLLQLGSLGGFMIFGCNDIFVINGVWTGYMLLPVGVVFAILFFTLSVNERIIDAYVERDHLRKNLQLEVTKKTEELQGKTVQLEQAMSDLHVAQAELIQSAKLASLGTLSAGIAHEINNSLNYVNGSLVPLERIVNQLDTDPNAKSKRLISMMKEGLELTFGIIGSLRNYTGLNQAKNKSVTVGLVVQDVINILKNRIPEHITLVREGNFDLQMTVNVVALNQVLMNLLTNAIDSMKQAGTITISSVDLNENEIMISVKDTGCGISAKVMEHIFDPFFTTKDVGKGTGLGLHIVKKEVEKHGGKIELSSEVGKGTEFRIVLPKLGDMKKAA